ncbi:MAG: DUF364 domain-containing protein [Candidatus Rokubacteria bacterium]|nr:DUF364 domain-containing protein [Candidatus Rokubacteria bacterium]
MGVIEAWLADLRDVLHDETATVADVRIGVFYTAAALGTGEAGAALTPRDQADTVCCPRSAAAAPQAGRLAGQDAWALAREATDRNSLRRAVGVAVLNALSARALARAGVPGGALLPGVDALQAAGVRPEDRVAMVGAFVPFIKALKGRVAELWVVDRHRDALKGDELPFWKSPEQALQVLGDASVVVITGSALVEGGLDSLLAASCGARRVVMAGPTASAWPRPFFERGVHVLGGIRVRDGRALLQVVSEGGSGYFFDNVAEKVCIVREGEALDIARRSAA